MLWETCDRYYYIEITTDLLGDRVLTKYWGGHRNKLGGMATIAVGEDQIQTTLARIARERLAHGYRLVAGDSSHFQHPIKDVAVNAACMNKSPCRPRSRAKAIQHAFDARKNRKPQPETRVLSARSRAPSTPRRLPDHSSNDSIKMPPQFVFSFMA